MSPNIPPIGILALRLFIEISADPASCPKLEREYQARNNVTRSVSPQRIRPTHASHADSSRVVTSVNNSNDRAWELASMPTALPERLARCSVMATCISCREELWPSGFGLVRGRQVEVSGEEVTSRDIVMALLMHAVKHVGVLRRPGVLSGQTRDDHDLVGEICFRHVGYLRRKVDLLDTAVQKGRYRDRPRRIGHGEHPHRKLVVGRGCLGVITQRIEIGLERLGFGN